MTRKSHLPRSVLAIKESIEAAEAAGSPPANTEPTPVQNDPPAEPITQPSEPASDPQGEPTPAPGDQSLAAVIAERDTWKHKYDVLQGMHNKLSEENRELRDDIGNLTRALSERNAQPAPPSQPDLPRDEEAESILGSDALAAIDRRVSAMVGKAVAPVAAAAHQTAVERFKVKVSESVPDWESVQSTEAFQSYMNETHPETGRARGEHLQDAIRAGDAERTARIYQNAKQELGMSARAAGSANSAPQVKPLAERVAPSGAGAASTPTQSQPRIYSRAELTSGYTELAQLKARGLLHGKTKERWDVWERDVVAAQAQGRIRPG